MLAVNRNGMKKYPELEITRKIGDEPFHKSGTPLKIDLLSFWQWSASDLVGNAMRGVLAEYIVASSLGITGGSRIEWDAYDLKTHDGIKVEVKSAAYIQSWAQRKLSNIQFGIRPTQNWDSGITEPVRQSNVYVFCLLQHTDQETIDPLNMDQWLFYVIATKKLDTNLGAQKTITLSSLTKLNPIIVQYGNLSTAIEQAANAGPASSERRETSQIDI